MDYLRVKNWEKFQHYKDRTPPWIKLHRDLLNDYEFSCLQDASKAHLMLFWLLASQVENKIPNDLEWIEKRLGTNTKIDIKLLIDKGFLVLSSDAGGVLADRYTETETYKEETEEADAAQPPPKELNFWDVATSMKIPRSLVGKWIKQHGETKVAEAIALIVVKRPADPMQFVTAMLQDRPEKLYVPKGNDEMMRWATKHFPEFKPGGMESYDAVRQRLWGLVRQQVAA